MFAELEVSVPSPSQEGVGCNKICQRFKSQYRTWPLDIEPDHCYCPRCEAHMNLPKDPSAKKDLCPCCRFQVRRRKKEGWASGRKVLVILLACGHTPRTDNPRLKKRWEKNMASGRPTQYHCFKCKKHFNIVAINEHQF